MNGCRRLLCLIVVLASGSLAWGQTGIGEFPQTPTDTSLGFSPRPSFTSILGNGIGYQRGYNRLGMFVPVRQEAGDFLTFTDYRLYVDYSGRLGGSAGLGHRVFIDDWNRTLGAYLYGDARNTAMATYGQISGGIESLGQLVDFRANFYAPIGLTLVGDSQFTPMGPAFLAGNNIMAFGTKPFEQTLSGADSTLSMVIPQLPNLRLFGGFYGFAGSGTKPALGGRGGIDAQFGNYTNSTLMVQSDAVFGTNLIASLSFAFPGGRPNPHRGDIDVRNRLADNVQKQDLIVVDQENRQGNYAYTDSRTGTPIDVVYVSQAAAAGGNGTFEHPFQNLVQAQNSLNAFDYLFVEKGTYYQPITLPANVTMMGDGTANVIHSQEGNILFPQNNPGATPTLYNINGIAVTLAAGDTVEGIGFNGNNNTSAQAIFGDNTNNITILNNVITNMGSKAIQLTGPSGTNVVSGNTITNSGDNAIQVTSNGTNNENLTVSNNTISTVTGDGIRLDVNTTSTLNATVTGNTVSGASKSGIEVEGNTASTAPSNITIASNTINQSAGSATQGGIHLLVDQGTVNTTITGNTINASSASVSGIFLNSVSSGVINSTVTNNTISGSYGNGVNVTTQDASTTNLAMAGNSISGTYTNGVALNNEDASTINATINGGNTFSGTSTSGVALTQVGTGTTNATISGNTFTTSGGNSIFVNPTGLAGSSLSTTISGNTFKLTGASTNAVSASTSGVSDSTLSITGNTVSGTYASAFLFNAANNSSLTSTLANNTAAGTFQHGVSATGGDSSLQNLTLTGNTVTGAASQGMVFTANSQSNLNVYGTGNSVTGSGGNGILLTNNGTANSTGQFYNNTALTGNTGGDLLMQSNGGFLAGKVSGNAVGGTIQLTDNAGVFTIDGNPVALNPGATVTVGPGVTTGADNFPNSP